MGGGVWRIIYKHPHTHPRLETVLTGGGSVLGYWGNDVKIVWVHFREMLFYITLNTKQDLTPRLSGSYTYNLTHKDNTRLICLVAIINYGQYEVIENYCWGIFKSKEYNMKIT